MRRTSGGGRKIYTAIEARIRADDINTAHGTELTLEGGGPIRVKTWTDSLGELGFKETKPLSPWLTRQNVITWLDAFELGIVYATKGADRAAGIFKAEGGEADGEI
jgi:hypothetical protein